MIKWKKGKPKTCIDCGLVMYLDDYEFARFDGENWEVFIDDKWLIPQEPIESYTRLNRPTE